MKNMKKVLAVLISVAMVFALAACGGGSNGGGSTSGGDEQETYQLKVHIEGSETIRQAVLWNEWADKITELSDGRVTFQFYYNSTLLDPSSEYTQLLAGVADLADMHKYAADGFKMYEKWKGFTLGTPAAGQVEMAKQLYDEFEELQNECAELHPVAFAFDGGSYQILTVKKPVNTVEDLKGMTIWCEADFNDFFIQAGATPVNTPWAEVYSSLQKNMYDGLFIAAETLQLVNFAEVCENITMVNLNYLTAPGLMMNLDVWNSLPADIQDIFNSPEVVDLVEIGMAEGPAESDASAIQWAIDTHGTNVIELSAEEQQKFVDVLNESKKSMAEEFDKQGLPGTEMLNRMIELSADYAE